jgi:hypothetical protein
MRLDAKKIVFNRPLDLEEAVRVFTIMKEVIDYSTIDDNYFYVYVKKDLDIFIETISDIEVFWLADRLGIDDRQALVCLIEYPYFWENLKDILFYNKINNYKRYTVFTKNDLMGEGNRTWEEYLGESHEEAVEFFRDILLIDDVISVIEMDDEEEEDY